MDLLFLKRLDSKHWLGLRLPPDLAITAGDDSKVLAVSEQWALDEMPHLNWDAGTATYFGPTFRMEGGRVGLDWTKKPREHFTGKAFAGVLADVDGLDQIDAVKRARLQLLEAQAKAGVSLPLRAYQAYIDVRGGAPRSIGDWARVVIDALAVRPGEIPVEAFGGLIFLVESDGRPAPAVGGATVFVDDASPEKVPDELHVKAFQHSKGVAFELADASREVPYSNDSVLDRVESRVGGRALSGYYRITRTLGVVERPSRRSGLVAIPVALVDPPGPEKPAAMPGTPAPAVWAQRRFRLTDGLAPEELVGELLNYRVELFNPHGRVVRAGRVMVQRQRLDPPAAPARAMARLVAAPAGSTSVTLRFDLPPTERADGVGLEAVLYHLENPSLPTGFYGDADDAAVQVARLLSDLDPVAGLGARAMDQVPAGASSQSAQTNLSNHGLTAFASFALKSPRIPPASPPPDQGPWDQCRWEITINQPESLLQPGRAVRLMLALRRVVPADSAGAVYDGPVPESPVLEPQLTIGFDVSDAARDQVVPHFERFWTTATVPPALLDVDRVFISESTDEVSPPREMDNHARVRIQVQHLPLKGDDAAEPVGGYRIWMRDLPARHAQGIAFEALAVVQAVPQLVKAYAPVEVGRQWWVQTASDDVGRDEGLPDTMFLTSPSPGAMIRRAEDGSADQAADELAVLLRDISEGRASERDVRGGAMLLRFWRLLSPDLCREVILTVTERRDLTRQGARAWLRDRPSNWIVFRDQNGSYLGRAWTFKGPSAGRVRRIHVLNEVPNTEDTVAVDDFGQMTWNWAGLQDGWHHELEWVVEPLSRYAPLRRRMQPLPSGLSDASDGPGVRYPVPPWQAGQAGVGDAYVHRLAILRRTLLTGRIGLVPAPEAAEDAFVWKVHLPSEFQRATHNTHARTALGALRIEVLDTRAETTLAPYFDRAELDEYIEDWCRDEPPDAPGPPPTLDSLEEGHELVIHQPACFKVTLKVRPRADTIAGELTGLDPAGRVPRAFTNAAAMDADHCRAHDDGKVLVVPLARLGWSYTGPARPTVTDVIGRLPAKEPIRGMPGLRLPDPAASMTVFIREDNGVLRPCAYFFGQAIAESEVPLPPNWIKEVSANITWGFAYRDDDLVTNISLPRGGGQPGQLVLQLDDDLDASRLRILWKRGAGASELLTPREP